VTIKYLNSYLNGYHTINLLILKKKNKGSFATLYSTKWKDGPLSYCYEYGTFKRKEQERLMKMLL
jgi:hypothetical protein